MKRADGVYLEASRFNERAHRFISALLVSFMMASAGVTIAQVGHQLSPDWRAGYLGAIGFLAALERFYSSRTLKKLLVFTREWLVLVSTQWVVNLIIIKLIVTLSAGMDTLLAEIPLWQRSFSEGFFTTEYLVAIGFAFLVWMFAGMLADLLDEMGLDAAIISREALYTPMRDPRPPRQRLMAVVFGIGAVLMFITSLSRVDLRAFFTNQGIVQTDLSALAGGGAGTLLYFLFGLALLSQSNYITLNTRWFMQQVPVSKKIAAGWAFYSLGFLLLILLIASILPTNYSLGLLSVLGYLLDILLSILMLIITIIFYIFSILISLLFRLLGLAVPAQAPSTFQPQVIATPPPALAEPGSPFPWLDLLKSLVFWIVFLGVVGYSISQYLRQHEEILEGLRKIPGWSIISVIWQWITGIFGGLNRRVAGVIEAGKTRLRSRGDSVPLSALRRFTSLRRLSPRQKVLFYYHALLRRGDETGLPRKVSQTPEEYAAILERSLPTVENEIILITDAFSEARYSHHPIEPDDADHVKTTWEQIRRVFRGRRG